MEEPIKTDVEQANNFAIAQMNIGQLSCNALTVNHYFQLGGFLVRYDRLKDLKDDTIVMTLEKMP